MIDVLSVPPKSVTPISSDAISLKPAFYCALTRTTATGTISLILFSYRMPLLEARQTLLTGSMRYWEGSENLQTL